MIFKRTPESATNDRPWKAEIERMEQTLNEVLQAVSRLSGVDLPGAAPGPESRGGSPPPLDCGTLKDRIRNDLEAFSASTASEIAKQAEAQTRNALATIRAEVNGQIEQVTGEFREKLQGRFEPDQIGIDLSQQTRERVVDLVQTRTDEFARWVWLMCKGTGTPIPVQIERLLEPYVNEAAARFTESFRRRVQEEIADQEQEAERRLQGTLSAFEGHVSSLEQAAQQICERNADSVTKSSAERLNAAADEAAKGFQGRIQEQIEGSFGGFRARLDETAVALREQFQRQEEQKAEVYAQRLDGLASEVGQKSVLDISSRLEQTAADVIGTSIQHLQHQTDDFMEHSREEIKAYLELQMEEVRLKVQEAGRLVYDSLAQVSERAATAHLELDQQLEGIRDGHLKGAEQQLSALVQVNMESLTDQARQMADAQLEEINKLLRVSKDLAASQYESQLRELTEGRYKDLVERVQKEAGKAGVRVSDEIKANSESLLQELRGKLTASALALREEALQASARIELSLTSSMENYRHELAEIAEAGLEGHRRAISNSLSDLQARLERSAQVLQGEVEEGVGTHQ